MESDSAIGFVHTGNSGLHPESTSCRYTPSVVFNTSSRSETITTNDAMMMMVNRKHEMLSSFIVSENERTKRERERERNRIQKKFIYDYKRT